eukprot:6842492-Pyramimonas_sp.AAC.1
MTSFYGSSCADSGKGALDTPETLGQCALYDGMSAHLLDFEAAVLLLLLDGVHLPLVEAALLLAQTLERAVPLVRQDGPHGAVPAL